MPRRRAFARERSKAFLRRAKQAARETLGCEVELFSAGSRVRKDAFRRAHCARFRAIEATKPIQQRRVDVVAHDVGQTYRESFRCADATAFAQHSRGRLPPDACGDEWCDLRRRKAETLMRDGVTIVNPAATYIDADVEVGRDTVIEPGVSLLGRTRVGCACTLRPYSTLTDAVLGDRVTVRPYCMITASEIAADVILGPFAHIRDGALIEQNARIGNFVEVKKSRVGRGTKSMHLAYIGDATLGEKANIGAGSVTCNYDGEKKNPTIIEDGVFIGSGSMLVAPVRIGKGSYVAAGSTITEDVPPESLALGRARQVNKEGWVRERKSKQALTTEPTPSPTSKEPV